MTKKKNNLGNPMMVAALAPKAADLAEKVVPKLLTAGAILAGIYFGRREYKKHRARQVMEKGTIPVQQALFLRSAMFRWGSGGLSKMSFIPLPTIPDGTDEEMMYQVAAQINDWPQVQKDYRGMFDSDLTTDMQEELKPEELQKFFNILNRLEIAAEQTAFYEKGDKLYALNDGTKRYHNNDEWEVEDSVDLGEYVGKIEQVLPNEQAYLVNVGWFSVGLNKVKHSDVTTDDSLAGLEYSTYELLA